MRDVHKEAEAAGCARASAAGLQGAEAVEAIEGDPIAALLGDDASAAPIEDFRAELVRRQSSLEREEAPEDGDAAMRTDAQRKAAALLGRLDSAAADGERIVREQQQVGSVMLQEASLATLFRAKFPPVPRAAGLGGGRRPESPRGGGRQVDGGQGAPPSGGYHGSRDDYDDYGGKGGGKGRPKGGKGQKGDGKGGGEAAGGQQRSPRSEAEYPVPCCEAGCDFRSKTPQALVTHHSAKHGDAPHAPRERSQDEWRTKVQWSTDAVVKATGVRPGEPKWHNGKHVAAGRGGGGGRSRARAVDRRSTGWSAF
jgi:hypothetical protein